MSMNTPNTPSQDVKLPAAEQLKQREADDIVNRFAYHPPTQPGRADEHATAREHVQNVALELADLVPNGREKSLMLTKLEEALFWANAGIARQ